MQPVSSLPAQDVYTMTTKKNVFTDKGLAYDNYFQYA